MLIKAITLFRLRAVSDFVFVFCSLINIEEAPICHWDKILTHTIFSQLFSFTLRYKLCLSEYSPSRPFLHALCVFDRLVAPEAQSVLCLSVLERAAHAHTHTHFSLRKSVSRVDCTFNVLLSNMSSNLVIVKTAFYNNRQTIDLILTLSFGQGGTNARRCEEKEVVLEETRL